MRTFRTTILLLRPEMMKAGNFSGGGSLMRGITFIMPITYEIKVDNIE
jgi:hypothetical protein